MQKRKNRNPSVRVFNIITICLLHIKNNFPQNCYIEIKFTGCSSKAREKFFCEETPGSWCGPKCCRELLQREGYVGQSGHGDLGVHSGCRYQDV